MHRDARHIVTTPLDFTRVQANSDIDAQLAEGIADRNRTLHGPGGTVEDREHSIARALDQVPTEARQLSIDRPVVLFESGRPSPVTECSGLFGRAHDVGEEDRGQKAVTGSHMPRPGQEFLDLSGNVCSAGPRDVVSRVELHIAGTVDVFGEVAPVVGPAEPVVPSVEHERRHA